jgi:hypothetical protein
MACHMVQDVCQESHLLEKCEQFKKMSPEQQAMKVNELCQDASSAWNIWQRGSATTMPRQSTKGAASLSVVWTITHCCIGL